MGNFVSGIAAVDNNSSLGDSFKTSKGDFIAANRIQKSARVRGNSTKGGRPREFSKSAQRIQTQKIEKTAGKMRKTIDGFEIEELIKEKLGNHPYFGTQRKNLLYLLMFLNILDISTYQTIVQLIQFSIYVLFMFIWVFYDQSEMRMFITNHSKKISFVL